jgi:hypothetical protein
MGETKRIYYRCTVAKQAKHNKSISQMLISRVRTTKTERIKEDGQSFENSVHLISDATTHPQILIAEIYSRAKRPTTPAKRPAAGLMLEAAPVKVPGALVCSVGTEEDPEGTETAVEAAWVSAGTEAADSAGTEAAADSEGTATAVEAA